MSRATPLTEHTATGPGLDGKLRADLAVRPIYQHYLTVMLAHEPNILIDNDPEHLHDFRVAVRKTRTLLGQLKGVFPLTVTRRFKEEFGWLAQSTSRCRDLDVALEQFDIFRAAAAPFSPDNLEPLRQTMIQRRQLAFVDLGIQLRSKRYSRLTAAWSKHLHTPPAARARTCNARRPIAIVAAERIRRLYKRILREGQAITADTPPVMLHELRKSCKKLRYLLESFREIYARVAIKSCLATLKEVQETLGAYQDIAVQIESLHAYARESTFAGETMLTLGALMANLHRRHDDLRRQFSQDFAVLASRKSRTLMRGTFGQQAMRCYETVVVFASASTPVAKPER